MNEKYFIVITGELASGKTSYGKKIAKELSIPFFSKDEIKELVFDEIGKLEAGYEEKRKLGTLSYSMLWFMVEKLMEAEKPFIIESNFIEQSSGIIKSFINKYNYTCITIRFVGNLEVLHKRFLKRENEERHLGLISNGMFDKFEDFKGISEKINKFKIDLENEIEIDTTDFDKIEFDDLIKKIQKKILPDKADKEDDNKEILEKCLPTYLEKDIKALKEGIKNDVSYVDCLINEVQGSINSAYTDDDISEEQCDYLYKKYIRMEK